MHPQNPIINTKPPITRNMKAGSKKIPIEIVLSLWKVSFSIHAQMPIPKIRKPKSYLEN
jgi:hypothetical protein